jgi:uncharacterized membrane protein
MTPETPKNVHLFDCIFVTLAIFVPIFMVIVASMLPEGSRGDVIVYGYTFLVAILGLALILRIAYIIGLMPLHATARRAASFYDRAMQAGLRHSRHVNTLH